MRSLAPWPKTPLSHLQPKLILLGFVLLGSMSRVPSRWVVAALCVGRLSQTFSMPFSSGDSVRAEQLAVAGFLSLKVVSWSLPWADFVVCSGASEAGFAFAVRACPRDVVVMFGRTLEGSRFWTDGDAREHAHGQFGVGWQHPVGG